MSNLAPLAPRHRDAILSAVAGEYNVGLTALLARDRRPHVAWARHVAAYLLRTWTGASYPETARILGGRDHTTIINSVRRVSDAFETSGLDRYDLQHRIGQIWTAVTAHDQSPHRAPHHRSDTQQPAA